MASMANIRSICKLNRIWWSPKIKKQVKIHFDRTIGTTTVHKFKTFSNHMDKVSDGNRKNWVSYGFSEESEKLDKQIMHFSFFITISICLTLGGYILIYLPDFKMKDWAQREAYLELRRRENGGLPPIDPNLIDPSKFLLPSDEELGDSEIII
ncbi:PREDICTED: NADH dehydrogenase [ubiquinone] 1 beta subcomplex subunit 11, mitochondrial [Ceratosolen solmsi marchali]|uniref:NADH dehydrogenase [ubiquinone] 1 beta subcomplex subunit 11, mitochondrial n=1 Tax=Ceratosolen solmsi marchali TaxID=326594 RepID=A0AAJ6YWZ6_9HYME|nr:PREDICTED: NADH dehydrogenase [ubiquinone] 1 beta subcomplex subunit 11, mitochondrial [Ceratosolen solmsi marchali]